MRILSYPLGPDTPTFLDNPPVIFTQVSSLNEGGVANWFEFRTINHNGTHLDAPFHYWNDGPRVSDFTIEDFIFSYPLLIDLPKREGELITADDLRHHLSAFAQADALVIRTGFGAVRKHDPARYGLMAPGFHPSAADVLLDPTSQLRAILMDIPSASSPLHLDIGHQFHREVLGATGRGRYLFLVEDCWIPSDLHQEELARLFVIPLFLSGLDAAPCTIIAGV